MSDDRSPAEEEADRELARLRAEARTRRHAELEGQIVEDRLASRRAAADLDAQERALEARLDAFEDEVQATRKAEDAEYRRAHWGHGPEDEDGPAAA